MAKLKRVIGFKELVIYAIGVIFGAGIYALIGQAAGATGPSIWMSFLFAAIVASFTGLSYAELSSIKSTTASEYHYVKEGFNNRRTAFLTSWLINAVDVTAITTVALGFAGYFVALFLPNMLNSIIFSFSQIIVTPIVIVAALLIAFMCLINYIGIKESVIFNILFTLIESIGLLLIIIFGGIHFTGGGSIPDLFEMPFGLAGMFGAVALIFFAYLGFEDLANLGEEVKNAKKNIPNAIIFALIITTIVYILVSISAISIIPWQELGNSPQPLADVASAKMGANGGLLLSFIALFATANTVLIMITATSRVLYGMAKDKSMPKYLTKISKKTRTPHYAIATAGILSIIAALLKDISLVAELTTLGVFIVFGMINASLIKTRLEDNLPKRRFKSPVNIGKFPVLALLGLLSCIWMIGTYIVKFTPTGIHIDLFNPAVILVTIEIMIGVLAYEILKRKIKK